MLPMTGNWEEAVLRGAVNKKRNRGWLTPIPQNLHAYSLMRLRSSEKVHIVIFDVHPSTVGLRITAFKSLAYAFTPATYQKGQVFMSETLMKYENSLDVV